MRNVEIRKKLCIEYLTPENVLSYVLVHEKGTKIHQQYLKFPVYNAVQRPQYVKNEPTLNKGHFSKPFRSTARTQTNVFEQNQNLTKKKITGLTRRRIPNSKSTWMIF